MQWLLFVQQAESKKAALAMQAEGTALFKVECLRAPTTARTVTIAVTRTTAQPPSAARAVTVHAYQRHRGSLEVRRMCTDLRGGQL